MSNHDVVDHDTVPPANKGMLVVASILLAIPVIALMLVSTYAKAEPRLGGWPFFFWYQMLWICITPFMTYAAYRLVLKARPHRPMHDSNGPVIGGSLDRDQFDGQSFDEGGDPR